MPTRDRRSWLPVALACFHRQTITDRELIVLDDGNDRVQDLITACPRARYFPGPSTPMTTGAKLNQLAHLSDAHYCAQWDDDDWYSPDHLRILLDFIQRTHKALVGYCSIYYWDTTTQKAHLWKYNPPFGYVCGASNLYHRSWILAHPQPDQTRGHDSTFANTASRHRQLAATDGRLHLVSRWHPHQFSPTGPPAWRCPEVSPSLLPPAFFTDCQINPLPQTPTPR